jgi:hypothetical protein
MEQYRPNGTVNPDFLGVGDEAQIRNADRRKRPRPGPDDNGLTDAANATMSVQGYQKGDGLVHDAP